MKEKVTGEFFAATKYTTREHPYQAPELVLEFDARFITKTPYGEPIAFGFARWENTNWSPTGFGVEDWCNHTWYLKEGDSNAEQPAPEESHQRAYDGDPAAPGVR